MSKKSTPAWSRPWVELTATEADWKSVDPGWIVRTYKSVAIIRKVEELLLELASENLVHGPMHSSIGQEGAVSATVGLLLPGDAAAGTHRGHHQFLSKALSYLDATERALDPAEPGTPSVVAELVRRTVAEILGLRPGFSGGRGGSMHLRWAPAGCLGTNAIVGGGVPLAVGHSWVQRRDAIAAGEPSEVTFAYFGDGAANIGSVLESMNLAAAWDLPTCFFIENNLYAVATHIEEVSAETRLSARGPGFGIPSWRVDGMDPLAVKLAADEALAQMRAGGGPTLIEADVYRFFHQNGPFPGSAFGYRTKEEEEAWRQRDPLVLLRSRLTSRKIWDDAAIAAFEESVDAVLARVADELLEGETGARTVREAMWPDPATVDDGNLSDGSELARLRLVAAPPAEVEMKFAEAIATATARQLELDPRVLVLGEDIHRLNGGTNGATRGLVERFPDRVLGTPISENAFAGAAGGMAATGRARPIVEFMFADFILVAADQLFNQVGKLRHMFGGDEGVPLVLRVKVGIGNGYGSQHSMDPTSLFTNFAGWRVVAPSTAADYVGALNTALALEDPVVILEHVLQYATTERVPTDFDYGLPLGSAALRRTGSGATVIGYLSMSRQLESIAEEHDLDVDLVDLRWLDAASIDWELIGQSVRKTGRVLIVDQATGRNSYAAWLGYEIQRRFFDYLDHPVERVSGSMSSPTISRRLESGAVPGRDAIAAAIQRLVSLSSWTDEIGRGA